MTPEQKVVQTAHAAYESARVFPSESDNTYMVMLSVPDEKALDEAVDRINSKGIHGYKFFEPDDDLGHTVWASQPIQGNQKRKIFYVYERMVIGKPSTFCECKDEDDS
jgi:hypothetical protein